MEIGPSLLRRYADAGLSARQVTKKIGVTEQTLRNHARRHGIVFRDGRSPTEDQIAKAQAAANSVAGQVHRLGIRITANPAPKMRNRVTPRPTDPFANILFNGEPLIFADTGPSCARCGVREDAHHQNGCGQFAAELRVRQW